MSVWNALKIVGQALSALEITEGVIDMTDSGEPREEQIQDEARTAPRTLVEEIEVEAGELVKRVRELIREGNVRTLRVKDSKGKYLVEVPLTVGVLAGGVFAWAAPAAAALGTVAGFVANVKIEVVREVAGDDVVEPAEDADAE